jgi:hypothetical protein
MAVTGTPTVGGECDRIGRDDGIPVAGVDDGRILADLRPNEETGIASGKIGQQRAQAVDREFAGRQNPVWLATRHSLARASLVAGATPLDKVTSSLTEPAGS